MDKLNLYTVRIYFNSAKNFALIQSLDFRLTRLLRQPLFEILKNKLPGIYNLYTYFKRRNYIRSNLPNTRMLDDDHYILAKNKDRQGWKVVSRDIVQNEERILNDTSNNTRLMVLHAYYYEESLRMFELVEKFVDYDIVITTPIKEIYDVIIEKNLPNLYPVIVENNGRDVIPFLSVLKFLNLDKYTHFIKLHSKRSSHLGHEGVKWYHENIQSFIGSYDVTNYMCDHIDNQELHLIGTEIKYIDDHYENNKHWLNYLIKEEYKNQNYRFVPGTMFLGSIEVLKLIKNAQLHLYVHEKENRQLDGCLGHALERYFGYLVQKNNGEILSIDEFLDTLLKKE